MKEVKKISDQYNVYFVTSEPGDGTRYTYFIFKDGDDYSIMPGYTNIRFPQKLNYWEVKDLNQEGIGELSTKEKCNPYTLCEVIRTIIELQNNRIIKY